MTAAVWILLLTIALLGVGAGYVVIRLQRKGERAEVSPLWLSEFSLARYTSMERLLSDDDLRFLETRPGYRPEIGKRFRQERRKAFRAYLEQLKSDFVRLHAAARQILVDWPEDNPELSSQLVRAQLRFEVAILQIEFRLALHWAGLSAPRTSGILEIVNALQSEVLLATRPVTAVTN